MAVLPADLFRTVGVAGTIARRPKPGADMRRRDFLALAAAWPVSARAQQRDPRKLAILMGAAPAETGQSYVATFLSRLEELGWTRGRNIRIETRWWDDDPARMQTAVSELLAFGP